MAHAPRLPGSIRAHLRDWVDHAPLTGRNAYGEPTYGAETRIDCRLVKTQTRVMNDAGHEVLARYVAWCDTTMAIGVDDRVTLPDGTAPPLIRVDRYDDPEMPHTRLFWS